MSAYLKEHLNGLGYQDVNAIGVNTKTADSKRKIREAEVIICVHEEIKDLLEENFTVNAERLICLDVTEQPESASKRTRGEEWIEYQRDYVYPALEAQIKKHLPL
jgi:hypothetical protein